ncbi:Lacal_2735 family protein [uncultured Dokdonia sp.]|uniref:Lacal_2735 family protein n=1 Tax=uncultured Dokdonia sp. TaxID=575653 RepID=UPI0026321B7B|nr:Lacal_2735 family protein [uncultured Dokdonia sp.]
MFGLFGKKSPLEKLQKQHKKILEDAFKLSKSNRSESDALYAKAAEIEKEIAALSVNK